MQIKDLTPEMMLNVVLADNAPITGAVKAGPDNPTPEDIVSDNVITLDWFLDTWLQNIYRNAPAFLDDVRNHAKSIQPSDSKPRFATDRRSAVIIGSGASLDDAIPLLHDYHGIILASGTNISALVQAGIYPDYVVVSDSSEEIPQTLSIFPYDEHGISLVGTLHCHPSAARLFPKNRLWFKSLVQGTGNLGLSHPYNSYLNGLVPELHDFVLQAGTVTNTALGIAGLLSLAGNGLTSPIERIYLVGVDLALRSDDHHRCDAYNYVDRKWVVRPRLPRQVKYPNGFVEVGGVQTTPEFVAYKRSLLTFWMLFSPEKAAVHVPGKFLCFDATPAGGLITEIPKVDIRDVCENRLPGNPYDFPFVGEAYSKYVKETLPKEDPRYFASIQKRIEKESPPVSEGASYG